MFLKRYGFWVLAVCLALVACVPTAPDQSAPRDACDAQSYQYLKWQTADKLDRIDLPARTRIYERGSAITQDYRPNRLNFVIGSTGRIEAIQCG